MVKEEGGEEVKRKKRYFNVLGTTIDCEGNDGVSNLSMTRKRGKGRAINRSAGFNSGSRVWHVYCVSVDATEIIQTTVVVVVARVRIAAAIPSKKHDLLNTKGLRHPSDTYNCELK
jgi:hypothetical protein